MPFDSVSTELAGVEVIVGKRFADNRGFFSETYKRSQFRDLGLPDFVQDNLSLSSRGVIRGLHWQMEPASQGKLVSCLHGSIFDVAVDIRRGSPTYGRWTAEVLRADEPRMFWVPAGFAHGFQALEDHTLVAYKVTSEWSPQHERAMSPMDADVQVDWPLGEVLLSDKDADAPKLADLVPDELFQMP